MTGCSDEVSQCHSAINKAVDEMEQEALVDGVDDSRRNTLYMDRGLFDPQL